MKIDLKIEKLRKNKRITQAQLAEHLGVTFQAVSKWENGLTLPDIALLPLLADYFKVSVDQLLGLQPLTDDKYISRDTNKAVHWNKKLTYLKQTREDMWNDDYLEFLVHKVWNINKPINIIDFGCGYGFLGLKLLPLIPAGSTYTGLDISKELLAEAKSLFKDTHYHTKFIECDFANYSPTPKYDLAICQAVLRHQPNAKEILSKMIDSVVEGGRVATIEVNRKLEEVGLYFNNRDYSNNDYLNSIQKVWNYETQKGFRDYATGFKIPFFMKELGLNNIDLRVNDKVNLLNTDEFNLYKPFAEGNGWHEKKSKAQKEKTISMLMSRGLSRKDADDYIAYNEEIYEYFNSTDIVQVARARCLLISTGIK